MSPSVTPRRSQHGGSVAERGRDSLDATAQARQHLFFGSVRGDEVDRVDRSRLPEAIDAADALFQAVGIPGELDVDDQTTAMMQVETLTSRVSRQQDARVARGEACERRTPRVSAEAAVEQRVRRCAEWSERAREVGECVAIFGVDQCWLAAAAEESHQRARFALGAGGVARRFDQECQPGAFDARAAEPGRAEHVRGLAIGEVVAIFVSEWQQRLRQRLPL